MGTWLIVHPYPSQARRLSGVDPMQFGPFGGGGVDHFRSGRSGIFLVLPRVGDPWVVGHLTPLSGSDGYLARVAM